MKISKSCQIASSIVFISITLIALNSPIEAQPFIDSSSHNSGIKQSPLTNQNPVYIFAKQSGISASSQEIERKKSLLSKLNPTVSLPHDSIISQMVVSDKFFTATAKVKPSDVDLRAAYDTLVRHLPANTSISFQEALPMLEMQSLVAKPENQVAMREKMETILKDLQAKSVAQNANQPNPADQIIKNPDGTETRIPASWPTSKVQIDASGEECLVFNGKDGTCVIPVEEFNRQALTMQLPNTIPLDSVRRIILDKALNIAYYTQKALDQKMEDNADVQKIVTQRVRVSSRQGTNNQKSVPEESLKKLYEALYNKMFAEREVVELDIVGSSDSTLVDSLYKVLTRVDSSTATVTKRGRSSNRLASAKIPWSRVKATDLPVEITKPTDTLAAGAITKPFKTPYGFFIARVAEVRIIKEVSFASARDRLFIMAQRAEPLPGTLADDKTAKSYYEQHKKVFLVPDTISLQAWLRPIETLVDTAKTVNKKTEKDAFDTTGLKSIKCTTVELPATVTQLLTIECDSLTAGNKIGLVPSIYGTWFFKVIAIKKGGGQRSYKDVADQIKSTIGASPQTIADIPLNQREVFIRNDLLAQMAWRNTMTSIPEPTDKEIDDAIKNKLFKMENSGDLPMGDDPGMEKKYVAGKLKEVKWRGEQEQWKATLLIDKRLFIK